MDSCHKTTYHQYQDITQQHKTNEHLNSDITAPHQNMGAFITQLDQSKTVFTVDMVC